jgi:hypothetical protein
LTAGNHDVALEEMTLNHVVASLDDLDLERRFETPGDLPLGEGRRRKLDLTRKGDGRGSQIRLDDLVIEIERPGAVVLLDQIQLEVAVDEAEHGFFGLLAAERDDILGPLVGRVEGGVVEDAVAQEQAVTAEIVRITRPHLPAHDVARKVRVE